MTTQTRFLLGMLCVVIVCSTQSFAQTPERRQANPTAQDQSTTLPPNATSIDVVANELGLLRKSLQTLNTRLREISEKVLTSGSSASGSPTDKQSRIAQALDLLTRAEQRAEVMRKQLIELMERETLIKSRLVQVEEELRPESIERATSLVGSTRTAELREVRRRVLENDRRGFESLLNQTTQSRVRLEEDVKQADALVIRMRLRLLPLIDKEMDKISSN